MKVIAKMVKSDPVYTLVGHMLVSEGKDEIVAVATPAELMAAVRQSGLDYDETGLEDVCTDMTYPGRSLTPVDGETPEQNLVDYLATASIQRAYVVASARRQRQTGPVVMRGTIAIDRNGGAKRLMDMLDSGEQVAVETE